MSVTQTNRDQVKRLYSDVFVDVRNSTGSTINAYKFLKISGDYPAGEVPSVEVINNTSDIPIAFLIGNLSNNANTTFPSSQARALSRGRVQVPGFDTSLATVLDPVYFDSSGDLTLNPVGKQIGVVLDLNSNGVIYIDLYAYSGSTLNWNKYVFNYSDFSIASNTNSIPLLTLGPKESIEQIRIKHGASFSGGLISDYRISVGLSGDLNKYVSSFDVFQVVSDDAKLRAVISEDESETLSTLVLVTAESFGGNLSDAISGQVEIQVIKGSIL